MCVCVCVCYFLKTQTFNTSNTVYLKLLEPLKVTSQENETCSNLPLTREAYQIVWVVFFLPLQHTSYSCFLPKFPLFPRGNSFWVSADSKGGSLQQMIHKFSNTKCTHYTYEAVLSLTHTVLPKDTTALYASISWAASSVTSAVSSWHHKIS